MSQKERDAFVAGYKLAVLLSKLGPSSGSGSYREARDELRSILAAHPTEPAEGTGLRNKLLRLVYSARTGFDLDAPSIAQPVTDGDIYLVDRILSLGAPAPDGGLRERVAGLASHYQGQADNPESPYYARGIWQTVANNLDAALRAQPPKETKG